MVEILDGQVILGNCASFTVTLKVQILVRVAPSVAFMVTVVVPFGKAEPLGIPLCIVTLGGGAQLSEALAE